MTCQLLYFAGRFETKPLNRWLAVLTPRTHGYASSWVEAERVRELSNMVVYGLPPLKMGNCLKLSILRYIHLRRYGFNVTFHMGVKPTNHEITGHAWLSLNGELLWEEPEFIEGFRETFFYPTPASLDRETASWPSIMKLLPWKKAA